MVCHLLHTFLSLNDVVSLTTTGHFSNTNILREQLVGGQGHRQPEAAAPPATPLAPPMDRCISRSRVDVASEYKYLTLSLSLHCHCCDLCDRNMPRQQKRARVEYLCRVCSQLCLMEQESIQCDGCECRLHQQCISMSVTQYVNLSKPHLRFFCR